MKWSEKELENMDETTLKEEHRKLVSNLEKDPADILASLTIEKVSLWHMQTGVAGEAGELVDAIKRYVIYGKPIDFNNVIEELGDLEFYMQGIRDRLGIRREETIQANILKLQDRYVEGKYTDHHASERLDKQ